MIPETHLAALFFNRARRWSDRVLLEYRGESSWATWAWQDSADRVEDLAQYLGSRGITAFQPCALISENRPEWVLADLAIMTAGAIAVPLYTSYTSRDHLHVLENSAAKLAFVSTRALAQTFLPAAHESDFMATAIFMEPVPISQKINVDILSWDAVLNEQDGDVAATAEYAKTLKRDEPATIIYTSGTGGAPKGVLLHHGS